MRLRVVGIGSPQGDDAVGLWVARRLRESPLPADVEVVERERPGLDLLDDLRAADALVLVDGLPGEATGRVRELDPEELRRTGNLSSHELGVADALALAKALGLSMPPLRILGVGVAELTGQELSPALHAALPAVCRRVLDSLERLRGQLS